MSEWGLLAGVLWPPIRSVWQETKRRGVVVVVVNYHPARKHGEPDIVSVRPLLSKRVSDAMIAVPLPEFFDRFEVSE